MFKIESYITPLLMGYLDKYVKLRPEDFQLSLWGGDAVLYNLDLRLDNLQKAIQLPIVFQSGHIHELRLHVPWTKLGSDPVVVTINTIECILKLRDTAYTGRSSRASSETPGKAISKQKVKRPDSQDLPPGYLQSLMNKIMNNVTIIINNLIVKFVEDDIVLSLNVKSAECYSVDKNWNRAFVELLAPDFVLRRTINFIDLTVCLDKRDASGKIENYQDPLVYRCSISSRLHTKYENIHGKYPLETKLNVYCERLDLSLTDTQLPMMVRLVEMCLALYYGTMQFKHETEEEEPGQQDVSRESKTDSSVGEPPPDEMSDNQQGWASWAWSYVPQILSDIEEEDALTQPRRKPPPVIFSLGMYAYKLTVKFKVTEYLKEKAHFGPRKIVFKPFLYLESEGISLDVLMEGLTFFNMQLGITNLALCSQGTCICGAESEEKARNHVLLSGGENLTNKTTANYICQSLFDAQSPENLGIPISKILDFDEHRQVYTEQYGVEKFGIFWMDYLYSMAKPEDKSNNNSSRSSVSSVGDVGGVFQRENSLTRYVIGQCHLNISSTTVHRVQKFLDAAYKYDYEPYSKTEQERVDESRPHPTEEQLDSLEKFIPVRTYHLTFLQPIVSVLSAEHVYCDVAKKTYRSSQQKTKHSGGNSPPLFGLQFASQRFDLQTTSAMYPRKLVQLVSKIAGPPSNLLHQCYSHTQTKLFGVYVGLTKIDASGTRSPLLTIVPPTSMAMYTKKLLLPVYWKNLYLPKLEKVYELPQISLSISKPGVHVVMAIVSSWKQNNPKPADIHANSLLDDVFPSKENEQKASYPVMECTMSGFELKTCKTEVVKACSGTVSSLHVLLYKTEGEKTQATPILSCPCNTDEIHVPDWLMNTDSPLVEEVKDDCLTFTYQLPREYDKVQAPAVVLLNIEGIGCSLDPLIQDWFSYTPTSRITQSREPKVELDLEIAKAASPLQTNLSQISVPSSDSKRQTLSLTRSPTTGAQSTVHNPKPDTTPAGNQTKVTITEKLAKIFPLIRVLQVQVDMKRVCIFLPRHNVDLDDPSVSVVENYQRLSRARSLSDTLVVCLPRVIMQSAGLKTMSALQEIPITSVEGSLVGDKIPWSVSLQNCSVYTVHNQSGSNLPLQALYLIKPATVSCTVGVSYKYTPPTSDTISALGLCLHTDMRSVIIASSFHQVKLLVTLGGQTSKLTSQLTTFLAVLSKSMSPETAEFEKPAFPRQTSQNGAHLKPSNQTLTSVASVTENDLPCTLTTSGDLASLDTSTSRELEIMETSSEGVKLSLWLQWTLPKCVLKFYLNGKQDQTKISALLEDMTLSVDVQDVYSKLKLNMGAATVNHYVKCSGERRWVKGEHNGLLMSCRDNMSHDTHIVTSRIWSGDQHHFAGNIISSAMYPVNPSTRELSHGFLNLTFTRALRKNVKKRLQKLNVEMPLTDQNESGDTLGKFFFHKYVSEVCVNVAPCDVVLCMEPVSAVLRNLPVLDNSRSVNKQNKGKQPVKISTESDGSKNLPVLNSSNLPLLYADFACTRVFIPGERTRLQKCGEKEQRTTMDHDMFLIQIHSMLMIPHAENPLPRYAVDKELYQQAVQLGVTSESGAALADRQYQLDVKGFSISTGCWCDFSAGDRSGEKSVLTPSTQIPAVEWNALAVREPHADIELFPLVSACDLKLVLAPAIVNYTPTPYNDLAANLVCGYGLEFNIVSDLDLHVSTNQIHLMQQTVTETMRSLSVKTEHSEETPEEKDSVQDSGLGSELSHATKNRTAPSAKVKGQGYSDGQASSTLTPVDLLLTAGRMSFTVYSHEKVEKLIEGDKKSKPTNSRKVPKKQTKPDFKWRVESSSVDGMDNNQDYLTGFSDIQDPYLTHMYDLDSKKENTVISLGTTCIKPFLFFYISQPHTVLSYQSKQQKFETSCYDVLVKGSADSTLIPVSDMKLIPDCSDYTVYWLETRAGQPHHVTGIPPSLYTLSIADFINSPANICLKLERPVKMNLSCTKMKQVMAFMEALYPRRQKGEATKTQQGETTRAHSRSKTDTTSTAPNNKTLALFNKVNTVELLTEQVVVSMETMSCDEKPEVMSSFSNLQIQMGFNHDEDGEVNGTILNTYMRDFLIKTSYNGQALTLIGPLSVKADGTYSMISHDNAHFLSQCMITMATGLVTVHVGQEQVLCLKMIMDHLLDLNKELFTSKEGTRSSRGEAGEDMDVPVLASPIPVSQEFVMHSSSDDLRTNDYQYIMDPDCNDIVPGLGEIVFCNKDREGNSSMTWSYSVPRVISALVSTPVPFNTEELVDGGNEVQCVLQYWEALIQQFVDYVDLSLSELEVTNVDLPEVRHTDTSDLVAAQIWRVLIRNPTDNVVILPASLAASMKIDSCFIPSLIPSLQAGLTVEAMELHLTNHVHCLGKETPTKLRPFHMSSCYQPTGEFAVISLDNILVAGSHWPGKQAKTQVQFSSQIVADLLEYKMLTMERVVSPFELSGTGCYQTFGKVPMLDIDVTCEPVTVKVGQGVIHNLTSSIQAWNQLLLDDVSAAEEVIFSHYVICNDTQQAVRFGQVGTDENLVLQPREMHQYGWRSHRMKQELHICLDGSVWKWCDAVAMNKPCTLVRSVTSSDQHYTLIITVRRISNTQNQVVISGLVNVSNRLSHHIEVKAVTMATGQECEHRAVAGSGLTVPSYVLDPQHVQGVRFRPWGSNGPWSKDVCISGTNMNDNTLIKLSEGNTTYHVWCRVFTLDVHKVQQIFVVVCPLYTVRSHLPHPLYINIDTSKLNIHEQIEAPGRGQDLQLRCPGGDLHQSLTFQFSSRSGKSSTSVTLSTGLIEQLQRTPVKQFEPSTLTEYWKEECWYQWPYSQEQTLEDVIIPERHNVLIPEIEMGNHPTIDLSVSLSELWAGYQTVLVDVAPSYLVTNSCDLDLVFMGTEDIQYDLCKGQTICPPKLEGCFHVGAKFGNTVHMSEPIPVSDEEFGAQRYRNDAGRTLYIDSWAHVHIIAHVEGSTQVCFLTVRSFIKHHIRVITVRERFNLTNLTVHSLLVCPFTVPQWSNKVKVPTSSQQVISSHLGCHRNKSDLHPLTFQPLQVSAESDQSSEFDHTTDFVKYMTMGCTEKGLKIPNDKKLIKDDAGNQQSENQKAEPGNDSNFEMNDSHWSFPLRLSANENGCRMSTSVVIKDKKGVRNEALCVSGLEKGGVTYFTIQVDTAPVCYIQNHCQFPLYFGQTLMNLTLKNTTIQEQTELVEELPTIPVGGALYYTPPYLNLTFPQIFDKQTIPKIHISGQLPNCDNQFDVSNLKWSHPIDLLVAADNFVTLPGLADVKVHVQQVAMVTHVTIAPITKADVSAKEIRSRLKGKDRTITVASQNEIKDPISPIENREKLDFTADGKNSTESKKQQIAAKAKEKTKLSFGIFMNKVSLIVLDDVTMAAVKTEILRLTLDDMFFAMYPASDLVQQPGYHRNCVVFSVGDAQLDNQVQSSGKYDFPVVFVRQKSEKSSNDRNLMQLAQMNVIEKHAVLKSSSLTHVQIVFGSLDNRSSVIETVDCAMKPVDLYVDDTFIFQCTKDIGNFLPVPLSVPEPLPVSVLKLPSQVKSISRTLSCPVVIGHLSIQPLSVLFSIHASMKVFIASDHTPLSFGKYEKLYVCTTSYQLIRSLAMHYASGALFRAGAVVGSLEILGNPTGLVRSIGTGVADFFRMPYRGLTKGPGAFVVGVSQGTSSMVKNVTTGMLKSVTNFASSVSRNMDRLSLDGSHMRRQEESRRHRPDSVGDGLKQGLTGLGISLLGAVAGLADHPIQSLVQTEGEGHEKASAAGLVTGMGKGLVGVFTKPIGGAAEFVSQTGQGILQGTGLSCLPLPRSQPVPLDMGDAACGQVKYALKLLQTLPSSDIQCCIQALHTDLTDNDVAVTLILTPEILFVVNHEEDSQQQSFSILELECGVTGGDNPTLSVVWKDTQTFCCDEQVGLTNTERVTAFIDGTTRYISGEMKPTAAKDGHAPTSPATMSRIDTTVITQNQGTQLQNEKSSKGRQSESVIQVGQLCDNVSDSSSDIGEMNMATLPQYDFKMSATRLAAFLAVFNITKHKLEGNGFPV